MCVCILCVCVCAQPVQWRVKKIEEVIITKALCLCHAGVHLGRVEGECMSTSRSQKRKAGRGIKQGCLSSTLE